MKTSRWLRGKCKCMVIKLNHYYSTIIKCQVWSLKKIAHSTYIGALNTYWSETFNFVYRNLLQFNFVLFQLLQRIVPDLAEVRPIHSSRFRFYYCMQYVNFGGHFFPQHFWTFAAFELCLFTYTSNTMYSFCTISQYGKQRRCTITCSSILSGAQLLFQMHFGIGVC